MMPHKKFYLLPIILFWAGSCIAQISNTELPSSVKVSAGQQYNKSGLGQFFWGKNWRQEWLQPIQVPLVLLDTLYGGLTPYLKSGGGESKSLRLRSGTGKEYSLRSINKTRGKTLPRLVKKTPYGKRVMDGVSMSHPYAAFALPVMLRNAQIYHAKPRLVYIPRQAALDSFNKDFADDLYLLEERPEGDWRSATHLGAFKKFINTLDVKDSLKKSNQIKSDQPAFIKARLFDMLIGDVDRHEGNWKWGVSDTAFVKFIPVPNDRDQAFFTHDGLLTKLALYLTRFRWMQRFDYKIKNVTTLTNVDRTLDHFFANEMEYADWIAAAKEIQLSLSDSVIAASINQMPTEITALSGKEIIEKLKFRRDNLQDHAVKYFAVLARKPEVNGTISKEHFEVKQLSVREIRVSIFRVDTSGKKETTSYYNRTFDSKNTKRVSIYGFGGEDSFFIDDKTSGIKIRTYKGINKTQYPRD